MNLLWHRSLLIALLALLVASPLTMAAQAADFNSSASKATSVIDQQNSFNATNVIDQQYASKVSSVIDQQNASKVSSFIDQQNASNATSVINQQNQSDIGQSRLPSLPKLPSLPMHDTFIASSAPSPASEPYTGFFSTWYKTGSVRVAAAEYIGDFWNKFAEGVGTKNASFVKKVVGAKVNESFFQGDSADTLEINESTAQVIIPVSESQDPSATYRPPNTVLEHFAPMAPLPSYNAIPQDLETAYTATPVLPASYYGSSSSLSWRVIATFARKPADDRPRQILIPEVRLPASVLYAKYKLGDTAQYVVTASSTKYYLPEPVERNVQTQERHDVVLQEPIISVGETRPSDPSHLHPNPVSSQPEYNLSVGNGLPPVQHGASPVFHLQPPQARQVQFYSYLPPQASHLIRNHGEERQARASTTTKLRDKISAGLSIAIDTYEYVKDFTYRASRVLGAFWPGNWFRPAFKITQPVVIQSAPVAALVADH